MFHSFIGSFRIASRYDGSRGFMAFQRGSLAFLARIYRSFRAFQAILVSRIFQEVSEVFQEAIHGILEEYNGFLRTSLEIFGKF